MFLFVLYHYAISQSYPTETFRARKLGPIQWEQDNSPTRQLTDTVFETIHRQILRQLTDTLRDQGFPCPSKTGDFARFCFKCPLNLLSRGT